MKKHTYTVAVLVVFSILFFCLPAYYENSEGLQNFSSQIRDIFFKIRHLSSNVPDEIKDVVIVTIDEESSGKLGIRWPWPRAVFARMIDELAKRGARTIGLNVAFAGLEGGDEASTLELARAMRDHGNVVIGVTFDKENSLVLPSPLLAEAVSGTGYLEKIVDPDFAIRRSYFLRPYWIQPLAGGMPVPADPQDSGSRFEGSFPLRILASHLGSPGKGPRFDREKAVVSLGSSLRRVQLAHDGSYAINYLASENDFESLPAWKVAEGKFSEKDVRGKLVLVGLTSSLFTDMHRTPYGIMSGIGIHANEYLSVASGRLLRHLPGGATFVFSWLASLGVLILFVLRRFWLGMLGFLLIFFALFVGAQMTFQKDLVAEPFILLGGPILALVAGIIAHSLKLLLENKGLETRVIQDKLTGLYTYEFLRMRLEDEWKRCQKGRLPVSIVMTDLDRFKQINDTLGHEVGNDMIKRAARVIKESVRGYDVVSRYGGDEFVILLWHTTLKEAQAYRERLRGLYHAMAKELAPELHSSSVSIGVATYDPSVDPLYPNDTQKLIEEADKDLFADKASRRKSSSR